MKYIVDIDISPEADWPVLADLTAEEIEEGTDIESVISRLCITDLLYDGLWSALDDIGYSFDEIEVFLENVNISTIRGE